MILLLGVYLFGCCPLSSHLSPHSSLSEETILDAIASIMVLPNHMCIPLIDKVKGDQMRFPLPHVKYFWSYFHLITCSYSKQQFTLKNRILSK